MPFLNPAVRHLHWMCHAPQLLDSALTIDLTPHLPVDLDDILRRWDAAPQQGPALLTATPPRRLGLYFEALYECLMSELLGWTVLARNLPIRRAGDTLGELDFIVRNPVTEAVEHHEIAVKFYLGYHYANGETWWHGPNARDRLDLKSAHLLERQSQRLHLKETSAALQSRGIPIPELSRIFMPGYLFYPWQMATQSPTGTPGNHARGSWVYRDEVDIAAQGDIWVPLRKPHWLGPWIQTETPDPMLAAEALVEIDSSATPRLFAALAFDEQMQLWREQTRFFVVPRSWPTSSTASA